MLVATRHYHDFDPKMGESDELQDRLLRTGERSFVLMVAGELPGDPEVAKSLRIADVFDWYQDCPLQIERAAISGS